MVTTSRRGFLLGTAGLVFATPAVSRGIEPIVRSGGAPKLQLGIAGYSYRKYLDLKKPSMTLFDFIDTAAELKVDGVELTSYYFSETSDTYIDKLKAACMAKKLQVFGLPIRNDFCVQDTGKLKTEIESVKTWIPRAERLGAKVIRIFGGNVPKGEDPAVCTRRVVTASEACCEVAARHGVTLALENHGGITATSESMLAIVKAVSSKAFAVNIDSSNFRTAEPFADLAKIVPYGVVSQIKTELYRPDKSKAPMDYAKFLAVLRDGGYSGPVSIEHEADEDPKTAMPGLVRQLRALMG